MSAAVPALAFLALAVYMLVTVSRDWQRDSAVINGRRRIAEIEREQASLRAERTLIQTRNAGLVTYDAVASWLPSTIRTDIEETRP